MLKNLNKEDLENIKDLLVPKKILESIKDSINLIELNPVIQGLNLLKNFNYSLYWPFILNASTFMCWSNVKDKFFRVKNCNTICKKVTGTFLDHNYTLMGNQTLIENKEKLDNYLKRIKNNFLIKRIVVLKY
jgi:hypothetical protein